MKYGEEGDIRVKSCTLKALSDSNLQVGNHVIST